MKYLLLLPLVLAFGLFVVVLARRFTVARLIQVGLLALLALAAGVLLLWPECQIGSHVVLVVDGDPYAERVAKSVNAVLDQLRKHRLVGYDVVILGAGAPASEETLRKRPWLPSTQAFDPARAWSADGPEAALATATGRFAGRGLWDRLWDGAGTSRVVVISTSPASWERHTFTDVPKAIRSARSEGVVVDLYCDAKNDPTATLEILAPFGTLPAHTRLDATDPATARHEVLTLRMHSPLLVSKRGEEVAWELPDATINRAAKSANGFELYAEGNIRAGKGTVSEGGFIEVRLPLRAAKPSGGDGDLPRGFHLVACRLQVKWPSGGRTVSIDAAARRYFEAAFQKVIFVAGAAGRFPLPPGAPAPAMRKQWHRLYNSDPGRWPWTVSFDYFLSEKEFIDWLSGPESTRRGASLLVLHDLREETWKDAEPKLRPLVNNGLNVLVSGLPGLTPVEADALHSILPALPALSPYGTDGKVVPAATGAPPGNRGVPWRFDRTPRLTFLADLARVGVQVPHPPTGGVVDVPAGPTLHSTGERLQVELIRSLCTELGVTIQGGRLSTLGWPAPRWVRADKMLSPSLAGDPTQRVKLDLWAPSSVGWRLAALLPEAIREALPDGDAAALGMSPIPTPTDRPRPEEIGINDVVVVFTYEGLPQAARHPSALAALLARGATVYVVPIKTPFAAGIASDAASYLPASVTGRTLDDYLTAELNKVPAAITRFQSPLRPDEAKQRLRDVRKLGSDWHAAASAVTVGSEATAVKPLAVKIARDVQQRLMTPDALVPVPHRLGRHFDERFGRLYPEARNRAAQTSVPVEDRWAAPRSFQSLKRHGEEWHTPTYASFWDLTPAPSGGPAVFHPRPAIFGGPVGRGLVLALGYSFFEDLDAELKLLEPSAATGTPRPPEVIRRRVFSADPKTPDRWGGQRVIDFAALCAGLEPAPGDEPRLRRVDVLDQAGRLRFEFAVRLRPGQSFPDYRLTPRGRPAGDGPQARLTEIDPVRQCVVYELSPNELEGMWSGERRLTTSQTWASLAAEGATGSTVPESADVFLARGSAAKVDLPALKSVAAVARYTGGVEALRPEELSPYGLGLHLPAALAVVAVLAALWDWRAVRRLLRARAWREEAERETRHLVHEDPAPGMVSAGQSLGLPVVNQRAGTLAGFPPLEPGQSLSRAVVEDVVQLSYFRRPVQLRVVRRLDERAVRLTLVVNVSRSVRLPRPFSGSPPKLVASALVAELLAEVAWARGAEVSVRLTGLRDEPQPFGPHWGDPGLGALRGYVLSGETQRIATPQLPRDLVEDGGRLVYISDFLTEDRSEFLRTAAAFEDEGGALAAIHVFSPAELRLLDTGLAEGLLCDRAEWLPHDLERCHRRFLERLEQELGDTAGGLTVVSSAFGKAETLGVLHGGRLFEVFR